ncbi:hypothetical protein D9M69_711980 [compost metagenome]
MIEQVAEEFPAGRCFIDADAKLFCNAVRCGAGRHRTGDALDAVLIARCQMRIGGKHGERIGRGHKNAASDDEIAVAITIRCRTEIRRIIRHQQIV